MESATPPAITLSDNESGWPPEVVAVVPRDILDEHLQLRPETIEYFNRDFHYYGAPASGSDRGGALPQAMALLLGVFWNLERSGRKNDAEVVKAFTQRSFGRETWFLAMQRRQFWHQQLGLAVDRQLERRGYDVAEVEAAIREGGDEAFGANSETFQQRLFGG